MYHECPVPGLDPASGPRPHRTMPVATPGASGRIWCVSSPATGRSGTTPEKGAGNLASSLVAWPTLPLQRIKSTGGEETMILFGDSRQQTFTEDLKGVARQPHKLIWAGHIHVMAFSG